MAKRERGLGRGLQALIPEREDENIDSLDIDIRDIHPNQYQPRKEFDQEKLEELSSSIKEHGLIQPIVISKTRNGYQIVAGERRWRAANMLGLKTIPAIVKDFTEQEIMEIALIENLQREDLNIIEEANAYKQLMDEFNLTQAEIGERLGKSRTFVTNTMRLLTLSKDIQEYIQESKLSAGHGRALLSIDNEDVRKELASKVIEEKLSVRELEKIAKNMKEEKDENKETKKKESIKSPMLLELEETLQRTLGTKVNIKNKNKKGKIEIEYYSNEDLDRILNIITTYS